MVEERSKRAVLNIHRVCRNPSTELFTGAIVDELIRLFLPALYLEAIYICSTLLLRPAGLIRRARVEYP